MLSTCCNWKQFWTLLGKLIQSKNPLFRSCSFVFVENEWECISFEYQLTYVVDIQQEFGAVKWTWVASHINWWEMLLTFSWRHSLSHCWDLMWWLLGSFSPENQGSPFVQYCSLGKTTEDNVIFHVFYMFKIQSTWFAGSEFGECVFSKTLKDFVVDFSSAFVRRSEFKCFLVCV